MPQNETPRKAIISRIFKEHGMSKQEADALARLVLSTIAEELASSGRFYIAEIGAITVVDRGPRRYFNPRTAKEAFSRGRRDLNIRISKQMKARLDRSR